MDFFELLNKIQEQFPSAIPFLMQPGVFKVYSDAVNNNWSADRVQSALEATEWWQQTDASTRQWQALQITDPATARTKAQQVQQVMASVQAQTGIKLTNDGTLNSDSFRFFTRAVQEGWDANQIKYQLIAQYGQNGQLGGEIGSNAAKIKSLANDYGVPLSDASVMDWARQMSQGAIDQNAVQGYLIEQAKSLFPALNDALDRGITVKQYASPYLQIAAQELNIDPNTINLTDGKWLSALNQVDQKTGQRVSMSLDQWLSKVRTDPAYGYDQTNKARQDATTLTAQLAQRFGAM